MESATHKIANKYEIRDLIGKGAFGTIYSGINSKSINNDAVAIKLESIQSPTKLLKSETTILKYLYDHGCRCVPVVFWFGVYLNNTILVMPLYECTLYEYINLVEISFEKVCVLITGCITALESIHNLFVLHRDIKPHNFMLKNNELFIIDFGLATFYINDYGKHNIDCAVLNNHITGNLRYASYYVHLGHNPSRRDDLISLCYMFIFLYCKELQWNTLNNVGEETECLSESHVLHYKNKQRSEFKNITNITAYCLQLNQTICDVIMYCYELKYDDKPEYFALKNRLLSHNSISQI
jgi:serine/threonine protein kinase